MFTDTDSLTYEITAKDVYKDFSANKDKFDSSDYPQDSPYFDKTNNKVIGRFKDEASGIPITEFIGLRFKMYSYIKNKDNHKSDKTAVIKKSFQHRDFKDTLFNNKQVYQKM